MPVYHSLTMTTPDNPAYENRPSHWNEAHSVDISGSEVIGAFSNAGNVSFAVETNGRITASANVTAAASPVNVTAGTTSGNLQTIAFSNSNGVSFGLNGSTITASHNGLTTAALSNHSHGTPTLNLTNLSGTTASNSAGLTLSLSAAAVPTAYVSSVNGSSGAISLNVGSSLSASTNGSSITFGLASNITTALQPAGAYLTTARASNDAIGLNSAVSNVTATINSSGLSLDARGYAGTGTSATNASITLNSNGLAISVAAPGGAASATLYATGNTTVNSSGTVALSSLLMRGYGIVSLGTSNGSVLVSSPDPTTLAPAWYAVGNTTGASSSTTFAADTISVQGTGGVSVGYSNGSLVISGATGGAGGGYSAGVSTGGNTAGATGITGSNMVFVGSGPISLSQTTGANGGTISINAPATSSLSATGILSISTNGSTISIGAGPVTMYAASNTTQASSNSVHLSALTFQGAGVASVGVSNGSVVISVPAGGGAGDGYNILAAGTQTATTAGSVLFENSNGISFGMSGSTRITASHNGLTSQSNQAWSGSNASSTFQTLSFNNANGASWSNNAGAVELSYTVPTQTNQTVGGYFVGNTTGQSSSSTVDARSISFDGAGIVSAGWSNGSVRISATQSNQAASAANGSFAFQTVNFSNANGVSFVTSAGSAIAASVETSYAASNHSHGNPTLALTNLSGTTASNSAGLTLSLSAAAGGGVNPVVSAANGSYSFTTLSLSNANGFSFGTSAGSAITGSYTVPSVTQYFSNTGTTFNGANISGSMTLNTNGLQLSMSVAAPGAAAENNAINLLGANTAGNTTATGSTIGWSGVNVTLSGTNASQVVISAPATSSLSATGQLSISTNGSTISIGVGRTISGLVLAPFGGLGGPIPFAQSSVSLGQNSLYMYPVQIEDYLSMDHIRMPVLVTNSSSAVSSGQKGQTFLVGVYTRHSTNGTLYSRHYSTSYTVAASYSSNVSWAQSMITAIGNSTSYNSVTASSAGLNLSASLHGPREFVLPVSSVFAPGEYLFAVAASTSGAGTVGNVLNISNMAGAYQTYNRPGVSTNATGSGFFQFMGAGTYSATTGALPASISATQINQLGTLPMMFAATGTV